MKDTSKSYLSNSKSTNILNRGSITMKIDLVIFDMDGVVFDSEKVYYISHKKAADELGMMYSKEYYLKFIGMSNEKMMNLMIQDFGDEELVKNFMKHSFSLVDSLIMAGKIEFKKGFLELTNHLRAEHVPYVLASSNDRQRINLCLQANKSNLGFSLVVSADDVKHAKPSPEIFNQAWQQAGRPLKERTLVIEDSHNGTLAANRANLPVAMVLDLVLPTTYDLENTLGVFGDLIEVENFLS